MLNAHMIEEGVCIAKSARETDTATCSLFTIVYNLHGYPAHEMMIPISFDYKRLFTLAVIGILLEKSFFIVSSKASNMLKVQMKP